MNTAADLKNRLLRLFPVATLKDHFKPVGKIQTMILGELSVRGDTEINQFVFSHLDYTRQHIYIFLHDIGLTTLEQVDFFDKSMLVSKHNINNKLEFNYLYKQTYDVVAEDSVDGGYEKHEIDFLQPIKLTFEPGLLKLCCTILERSPSAYLPGFNVVSAKKREDDKDLIEQISTVFFDETSQALLSADLNKGVKALWAADEIDARSVKIKGEHSTDSYVMDEDSTFKQKYPELYKEVIKWPLKKHLLRFTPDVYEYGEFECDVTEGTLSFNKYPTKVNTINDVISKIIAGN